MDHSNKEKHKKTFWRDKIFTEIKAKKERKDRKKVNIVLEC